MQALHGLFEELAVHLEADAGDVAVLLGAKQVARAADLEVAHGDLEAGAELSEFLHGLQALLRRLRQDLIRLVDEVREGHVVRAADAPAHLVELRQAEMVGVVDNDGIGIGDIEAVLDDARREQDVVIALVEVHHDVLEHLFRHLPVCRLDPRLRHERLDVVAHAVDCVDAVVDEVDLAAALHLAPDGVRNNRIVVLDDVRLHGEALGRRRLDDAHVTRADKRHVQRARYRRRRERQDVDARRELADLVLLLDAEALLLVDDQETEVLPLDLVLVEDGVRANQDVHLAEAHLLDGLLLLFGCAEAADDIDDRREAVEARRERLVMLLREDRRRHEYSHLLAIHRRLVGRADGDLRLAEADVAAEQAVHGLLLLHIRLDLRDGAQLVFRLLIGKGILELALARVVRREGMTFGILALRVDLDELLCDVLDRLLGARLGLDPLRATHAVQARHIAL